MRRVPPKQSALFERLHDEGDVALFEVTHAAVHEFRAATGGALAEVVLLEEQNVVAPARRVHRDADAGGAAADDDHVPGVAPVEARDHVRTAHHDFGPFKTSVAV